MTVRPRHDGNAPWHHFSACGPITVDLKADEWPRRTEAILTLEAIKETLVRCALPDKMRWGDIYPYPPPERVMQPGDLGIAA